MRNVSELKRDISLSQADCFSNPRGFLLKSLLLILLLTGMGDTAIAQVVWSDEFETGTSLDSAVWSYDLGSSGWGNQEVQTYTATPDNVRVEDGNLVITVLKDTGGESGPAFTSARVKTQKRLNFKYGTIEARIKIPDLADGLWPAFWTLGDNFSEVGWPFCGELDVMEMGSSSAITQNVINRRVGSAAHWQGLSNQADYGQFFDTASDLDDGFHIFSMNWTPENITTYIDGQQIWTFRIKECASTDCDEFHKPHFIILNVAVGGTYTGIFNSDQITAETPAEMLVDYIRIIDNGYTELGGSSVPEIPPVGAEYSGSWYNPDQSGHGFSMEFGKAADESPLAVIYWYTYDSLGNPIFHVGNGVLDGATLQVQFESPYGMKYGEFDPDSVVRENGGTGTFTFSDANNGTFSYTPSAFSTTNWGHTTPIDSLPLSKIFAIPVSNTNQGTSQR